MAKKSGSALPAVWISGFYGSGKSSFAKLLGLSLDNLELPNHRPLAEALLERDDSPRKDEFREAWHKLRSSIDPIAVVFDIGSVAREGEQIHSAVKREIQKRLGYCPINYVADFELKLELDGKWEDFLRCAGEALNKSWSEVRQDKLADEDFSQVMYQLEPDKYIDPMSWYDSHVASDANSGSSVAETVSAIAAMLKHRAPKKTLFVVVDEVSQYIYQNDTRMLKLQSFVADLGQKLKGKVWLLATGQQKLEDNDDESNIGKLKDRFPPHLRVHLDPANIRDVVHKRLLKKAPSKEAELRSLFQQNRSDLKLYSYGCESITEEDFLEVYPLLPGYIDLLMQIASSLRVRSARVKGDDYAIRGLLQLLGDLFREQNLAEKEVGELITLDRIYDIQGSSLDADMQNTLTRLFAHREVTNDEVAIKVAKVVALLELIQEQQATTTELIGKCLYQRMGMGNTEPEIQQTLDKLRNLGLISYSEKLGYKIQSSAGQEWQREREDYGVTNQQISEIVSDKLKELLGTVDNPRYKGKSFRWSAFYSDDRAFQDKRLQKTTDLDVITVDFRYLTKKEEKADEVWIRQSAADNYKERIFWVIGSLETLPDRVRELARSQNIIKRYGSRAQSMTPDKQRLFFEEQSRCEELEKQVKNALAERLIGGQIYFQGRTIDRHQYGTTFAVVLKGLGDSILPTLYEKYVDIAITDTELKQLLELNLSGISDKFMSQKLGIFELDAGKYQPSCKGDVPSRILQYLTDNNGSGGTNLLQYFGCPPFGYGSDVVKACIAGLLELLYDEWGLDLPGLFGRVGITELLPIPSNTLRTTIEALNDPELESAWKDDTTLGWVYQFWNDPDRKALDEKINNRGKIEHHEIAAKTQIFTERYMVEWLLQNSLNQQWLAICAKNGWTPEVKANGVLDALEERRQEWREKRKAEEVSPEEMMPINGEEEQQWKYWVSQPLLPETIEAAPKSIRDLKLIDPAVGSGHFLVIAFSLLFSFYKEEAEHRGETWKDTEIAESIIENNLHGVDLDSRAVQIAAAALFLKAKSYCPDAHPRWMNLVASNLGLSSLPIESPEVNELQLAIYQATGIPADLIAKIIQALHGADHLGSLLKIDEAIETAIAEYERQIVKTESVQGDLFTGYPPTQMLLSFDETKESILTQLGKFLAKCTSGDDLGLRLRGEQLAAGVRFIEIVKEKKYHLCVANPPYLGQGKIADKAYIEENYPDSKSDLCTVFLQRGTELIKPYGIM